MIKRVIFGGEVEIAFSEVNDGNMRAFDGENEANIIENQAKLSKSIDLKAPQVARIRTVYDDRKVFTKYGEITTENLLQYSIKNLEKQIPVSDGLVTKAHETGILLPLADCLGVVVFDTRQKTIGLLHSGRQNIEQNGPRKFIEYLTETFGSNPKDLKLYYSPHAINYQIHKLNNKNLADAATEQFLSAGVLPENIENPRTDTVTSLNLPSNSHGDTKKRFAIVVKLAEHTTLPPFPENATDEERVIEWYKIAETKDADFGFNTPKKKTGKIRFCVRVILPNDKNEILVIKSEKYGYMQIPGGGIERDENIIEALRRETEEETGFLIKDIKPLGYMLEKREDVRNEYDWDQDISFVFTALPDKKVGVKYTEDEVAEGFKPIWIKLEDFIAEQESNEGKIKSYSGCFSNKRDLEIAKYFKFAQRKIITV